MSSNPRQLWTDRRRDQHGAVVVEAALVVSLFLIPMLVGVITLGERLWHLQKHDPYEPRIYTSQIVGTFDCAGLLDRVRNTVVNNVSGLGVPIDAAWVSPTVIEADATGVLVQVSVSVPPESGSGDPVVLSSATRLDNVQLTSLAC